MFIPLPLYTDQYPLAKKKGNKRKEKKKKASSSVSKAVMRNGKKRRQLVQWAHQALKWKEKLKKDSFNSPCCQIVPWLLHTSVQQQCPVKQYQELNVQTTKYRQWNKRKRATFQNCYMQFELRKFKINKTSVTHEHLLWGTDTPYSQAMTCKLIQYVPKMELIRY